MPIENRIRLSIGLCVMIVSGFLNDRRDPVFVSRACLDSLCLQNDGFTGRLPIHKKNALDVHGIPLTTLRVIVG